MVARLALFSELDLSSVDVLEYVEGKFTGADMAVVDELLEETADEVLGNSKRAKFDGEHERRISSDLKLWVKTEFRRCVYLGLAELDRGTEVGLSLKTKEHQ